MGAPTRPFAAADGQLGKAGPGVLRGYTLRETAGQTATVTVYDGTSAAGTIIATVALAANGSATVMSDTGVRFDAGAFCDVAGTGTVVGSVFIG
jgi:hypothetical protein